MSLAPEAAGAIKKSVFSSSVTEFSASQHSPNYSWRQERRRFFKQCRFTGFCRAEQ